VGEAEQHPDQAVGASVKGGRSVLPVRGPASSPWREHALARAAEYRFLVYLLVPHDTEREKQAVAAIEQHLDAAERAAEGYPRRRRRGPAHTGDSSKPSEHDLGRGARWLSWMGGAAVERANSHLDAVETDLLRLVPDPYLRGQLPNLVAHVRAHLPPDDPRRQGVEKLAQTVAECGSDRPLKEVEVDQVVSAVRAASLEGRREIRRVRSFRNVLYLSALFLALGAIGMAILGAARPDVVPLCFAPDETTVVCPATTAEVEGAAAGATGTGGGGVNASAAEQVRIDEKMRDTADEWDILLVELVGLMAAALASATALRSIQGSSTPYSLPAAVAILKLPAGALTAVLGLLLMRGEFIPGLSALDSSGQIVAWAVLFGYAQQLLTRLVDQRANTVLDNVRGPANPQLSAPTPGERVQPQPA
jgi:hypothetical protein